MREGTSIDKNEKLLNIVFPTSKGWNEPGFPCKSVGKFLINSILSFVYFIKIAICVVRRKKLSSVYLIKINPFFQSNQSTNI